MNAIPERISAQLKGLEERADRMQAVIASLRSTAAKALSERAALAQQNEELLSRIEQLETENDSLRSELDSSRRLPPEKKAEIQRLLAALAGALEDA